MGAKVEIHGQSQRNDDLNGVVGTVRGKGLEGESHRYIVQNDADEDELIGVKPENLKFLIPPGLQFADENKNSFVFTGWFRKEKGGNFNDDRKRTKVSPFDERTFTWNPKTLEWHSPKTKANSADPKDGDFWMNKEATRFISIDPKDGLRCSSAKKVESNQNSGSAHRSANVMAYQWQLHLGDSGEASTTDKVWIKLAPATPKKSVVTKPVIKMIAEVLKLDGNSFVFTEWVNGKKSEVEWPQMKNIKFTWDEATKEWTNEEKSFYMNEEATKFYKGKADKRQKVATKLSANQNSGSARRTDEQMKYHWQLHKNGVTDIVNIKPTGRRRLGASPVLCALMDEIASQQ